VFFDSHGNGVWLFERDCSVQRRHQKVVEIAPSINLPLALRQRICDAAVRLCKVVRYQSAGTVEFLVDVDRQEFYFIEVNPRIQVEHTVTEMVTGIDLVRAQILIAQGQKLHAAPLSIPRQEAIRTNGVALQCRITTEDPENLFIPDYGRISTYRSPGGFAVRLDGGNGFGGAVITPYFDSLLVKMTTWGQTLDEAVRRADRSLRESLATRLPISPERATPWRSRATQNPARMESPFTGLTVRQSLAWYFLGRKPVPMRGRGVTLRALKPLERPRIDDVGAAGPHRCPHEVVHRHGGLVRIAADEVVAPQGVAGGIAQREDLVFGQTCRHRDASSRWIVLIAPSLAHG
jgi:hypothetical protein